MKLILNRYINSLETEHKVAGIELVLIPFFTIVFGILKPPTEYTLSMIGNRFDLRLEFVIWGIVTSSSIVFLLGHIYKLGAFENKRASKLLVFSGIFLVFTVLVPAYKGVWPVSTKIHALFGALFAMSLVASIFYFLRYIGQYSRHLGRISTFLFLLVVCGSLTCMYFLGNTGVFELYFFISFSLFLLFLGYIIAKERKNYYKNYAE